MNTVNAPSSSETPPAPEPWFLWLDGARSPYMNMAVDQALLVGAAERARPLLRLYDWDRPAVSIGYVQKAAEVNCGERTLVRRPTGGGVVYHDHDVTYTVAIPPGHWIDAEDRLVSYRWINRAVQAAMEALKMAASLSDDSISKSVDRATMVCFTNPTRYDIMADNVKVAGSAQRRTRDGLLHQGSINLEHAAPDTVSRDQVKNKLQDGFRAILNARFEPWAPAPKFLSLAAEIEEQRYALREWNHRR